MVRNVAYCHPGDGTRNLRDRLKMGGCDQISKNDNQVELGPTEHKSAFSGSRISNSERTG